MPLKFCGNFVKNKENLWYNIRKIENTNIKAIYNRKIFSPISYIVDFSLCSVGAEFSLGKFSDFVKREEFTSDFT